MRIFYPLAGVLSLILFINFPEQWIPAHRREGRGHIVQLSEEAQVALYQSPD